MVLLVQFSKRKQRSGEVMSLAHGSRVGKLKNQNQTLKAASETIGQFLQMCMVGLVALHARDPAPQQAVQSG